MELIPNIPMEDARAAADPESAGHARSLANMLTLALMQRRPYIDEYQRYYNGQHAVKFDTDATNKAFATQLSGLVVNWPKLVVNAAVQRMSVQEFVVPSGDDLPEDDSDAEWMTVWRWNQMQQRQQLLFREMSKSGSASILVTPMTGGAPPRWTIEHPGQMIVARDPETGLPSVALKQWHKGINGMQGLGQVFSTLYVPGGVWRFQQPAQSSVLGSDGQPFIARDVGSPIWQALPGDVLPVVPFINEENLFGDGTSDLASVIPLVNVINKYLRDSVIASDFHALPKAWVSGVEAPQDPRTGQNVPMEEAFKSIDRLYNLGEDGKMGQLPAADGRWTVDMIELVQRMIAAISQTPQHYFDMSQNPPSADSIEAAEAGLIARVDGLKRAAGHSFVQTLNVGDQMTGRARKNWYMAEPKWAATQRRALSQMADAFSKTFAGGAGTSLEFALKECYGLSDAETDAVLIQKGWNPRKPEPVSALTAPPPKVHRGPLAPSDAHP